MQGGRKLHLGALELHLGALLTFKATSRGASDFVPGVPGNDLRMTRMWGPGGVRILIPV